MYLGRDQLAADPTLVGRKLCEAFADRADAELNELFRRACDRDRGVAPSIAWLAEEFGELAQAVRKGSRADIEHEFSDVLAWVASLANQVGVDLTEVVDRYRGGCPKCSSSPCVC